MVIARLKQYSSVCRLCLKLPESSKKMVPVSTNLFHGTVQDYISLITFDASEKSHLFPQQVCHPCLEILRWHAKYQTNIMNISLLVNALAELKLSNNSVPLEDLFRTKGDHMQKLFEELELNYDVETCVADIIKEFSIQPEESNGFIDLQNDNIYKEIIILLEPIDFSAYQQQISIETIKHVDNVDVVEDNDDVVEDCSISESEITLGNEIELAAEKEQTDTDTDQPKKRGRPRKEIKTLRCRNCTEVFHDKKLYDHHRWTAHKLFVCKECGLKYPTRRGLDKHLARHRNEEEFQCEYCQRLYNVQEDLNHHIKERHVAREKYHCETCVLEFKNKGTFDAHKLTHKDEFGYPCTECDKKFKSGRLLHAHKYRIHKEPSHSCDECGKAFRSRFRLLDHIEIIHGIQMRFICDICVEAFDDKDKLKDHKSRHQFPSELQCGTCLVVFNSKDQMFNHLCITYKKDYFCCNKDHGHHKTYNKHQLVKHGVKMNVRVKPKGKELAGKLRSRRKRVHSCPKCFEVFPSRPSKQQHVEICGTDTAEDS